MAGAHIRPTAARPVLLRRDGRRVVPVVVAALAPAIAALGAIALVTDTIMADHPGRARLARTVLEFVR